MINRKYRLLPLLAAVLLVGCGGEKEADGTDFSKADTEEQRETTEAESGTEEQTETAPSASEPETAESEQAPDDIETKIKALEVRTWQSICGESASGESDSAEAAMRNSARENMGYLTWSGNGENIYYSDLSEGKIYACTAEGEEKICLYEKSGTYLQEKGGWLYAKILAEGKTVKINCETGECVDIFTESSGEHFFLQDELYFTTPEEFCAVHEEDGSRTYYEKEFELVNVQPYQNIVLATAVNGEDTSLFLKGYLLGYDMAEKQCFLVKEKALWFLAAGSWLSYYDMESGSRHVLNGATGEDTDLGMYTQYIASDGAKLYYQGRDKQIYCWDGQEAAPLAAAEREAQYFFLTPTHLYWMQTNNTWWYYDLESGKSGGL